MQKTVTDKYASANLVLKDKQEMGALLIGDITSSVDKHILKPHKISTIITIGQDSQPEKKQQNIKYILHNVLDNKSQKISDLFDIVYEEIQQGRKIGGVLVHCYTGISRSSSFVIAYLMRKKFISYDDAKAFVKKQRSLIQPNDNFHRQLQGYWKVLVKRAQQQRLRREKQEEEKKQKQIESNYSSVLSSNISGFSKRTVKGVKGAVRSAIKQQHWAQNKSIEQTAERSIQKQKGASGGVSIESVEGIQKKKEQKKKQVKGIYGNKTKVM